MATRRVTLLRLGPDGRAPIRHPHGVRPPFTLKYLQALLLQRGVPVRFLDGAVTPRATAEAVAGVARGEQDLVVCSSTPLERDALTAAAAAIRAHGGVTMAVGPDVSLDPAFYANGASPVDVAIPGEAEQACAEAIVALQDPAVLPALQAHYRDRLSRRDSLLVESLDALPFPVYAPGELAQYPQAYPVPLSRRAVWGHLLAGRGCPYPCLFCTQMTRESYGRAARVRDPEQVAAELAHLQRLGATVASFDDDNLTTDARFVQALCRAIIRRRVGLPWIAHARVDNGVPELAALMAQAGCVLLRFGIESAVPRIVAQLRKGGDPSAGGATTRRTVTAARRAGIAALGLFIIGNPGETEPEVETTIRFALDLPLEFAQVHFFTPYVGSGAYRQWLGSLDPALALTQHHYRWPQLNLSRIGTRRLVRLRAAFYRRFYGRPGWLARHLRRYAGFYACNAGPLRTLAAGRSVLLG